MWLKKLRFFCTCSNDFLRMYHVQCPMQNARKLQRGCRPNRFRTVCNEMFKRDLQVRFLGEICFSVISSNQAQKQEQRSEHNAFYFSDPVASPIGSMGLVYVPPFVVEFCGFHVQVNMPSSHGSVMGLLRFSFKGKKHPRTGLDV